MFQFRNKKIFVISPEAWGNLRVSKHHYATELVKLGNTVYFFEPPNLQADPKGEIIQIDEGVQVFRYKPLARGKQFIGRAAYTFLQKWQMNKFFKKIGRPDIVWCFDYGRYDNLRIFGAPYTIFHPVDHNSDRVTPVCAHTADYIFSTSHRILAYMKPENIPGQVINHGLNRDFEKYAIKRKVILERGEPQRHSCNTIGFWGNLFKESLDRKKIRQLVDAFPNLQFHFWGPYEIHQNNVNGHYTEEVFAFIEELKNKANVKLFGPSKPEGIINSLDDIDLLINLEFESSAMWDNGNPHKVLEYIATGKPVLSTPVIMYQDYDFFFCNEGDDVIGDMNRLMENWAYWNASEQQLKRIAFALNNTYSKQISKIESLINQYLLSAADK